ncbi:hypothetical protein [Marinobacter sp. SS21]|uniref:hypothetical protein n=1 Tax=Marinobacter sp. SS21 TaxID=2979460 RepID=UPI00232C06F9|nr:hypothetical protein [Marinobacter sp. SS21]MDC0661463.1 hypothetical protein [Marinobacter sp. SS21]
MSVQAAADPDVERKVPATSAPSKATLNPDSLSKPRSILAYLALFAGIANFVPGNTVWASVFACLAIVLGWGNLRRVGKAILVLIVLLALSSAVFEPTALAPAAGNMARISALIITVMLLSAVLGQTRDLKVISRSLFGGRSTVRYMSMTFGTTLLAIPLNFASVGVVATMIGLQVKERGDSALARNAARAVVRGFGGSPMTSPLSISIVMTVTFLPGLSSWKLIAVGLPVATLYLLAGALAREQEPPQPVTPPPGEDEESALLPWLRFVAIIALICLGAFALSTWVGLVYSLAVTLSCLAVVILGLLHQWKVEGVLALPSLAAMNNELVIMGGASFLGGIIGTFALTWLGMDFSLQAWAYPLVAIAVPWLFFVGGAVGINPIISGTLSGSILGPIWPEYGLLGLGLGMVTGWGITIAGTPYSANALLLERCTGYSAQRAAYEWSLRYSLIALTLSSLLCMVLTLP